MFEEQRAGCPTNRRHVKEEVVLSLGLEVTQDSAGWRNDEGGDEMLNAF